jgi:hypothetical protein
METIPQLIVMMAVVVTFLFFVALLQAVQKLATILTKHLERQHVQGQETLVALMACAEQLQDIKESLFFSNNRQK